VSLSKLEQIGHDEDGKGVPDWSNPSASGAINEHSTDSTDSPSSSSRSSAIDHFENRKVPAPYFSPFPRCFPRTSPQTHLNTAHASFCHQLHPLRCASRDWDHSSGHDNDVVAEVVFACYFSGQRIESVTAFPFEKTISLLDRCISQRCYPV